MILCCGEALIDLLPESGGPVPVVGGSVLNTAVAIGRLGADVGLLTGLSSDEYGALIEEHLSQSNVSTAYAVRSDRPTTLAIVALSNGQAQYRFEDEGSALRMISPTDLPELPSSISAMVFGGISLIPNPVADTLAHVCTSRPAHIPCLLDANVRPALIDNPEAYRNRLTRMLAASNLLKVSDEDLEWLLPEAENLQDAIVQLLKSGPQVVLITKGEDGAEAHIADRAPIHVAAVKSHVVDTVGAGDTFNAGLLYSLQRQNALSMNALTSLPDQGWQDALQFACRAAAITVSRAGANPPNLEEVNQL